MSSQGLLLINLGTPTGPTPQEVRRYLREFLSDPFVITLPAPARWLLLNAVILPFRPRKSAAAYQKIWTPQGSPLLVHSFELVSQVARALEGKYFVQLGMRYGQPDIPSALRALSQKGVTELVVLPLYPQYATSSTETALKVVRDWLSANPNAFPKVRTVESFYQRPSFLDAFAEVARPVLRDEKPDHILMSFHGLPIEQVKALDATGAHCSMVENCCERITQVNSRCYRAQSIFTARALADRLSLGSSQWSLGFQSRLSSRWLRPFSDEVIVDLARRGVRRVAVMCPSFVADCLETLEEIAIRMRESFTEAGGESLTLVPSLNAHPRWIEAVVDIARSP